MSFVGSFSGAKVKTSSIPGDTPGYELEEGELAVNATDGTIFVKYQGAVKNLTDVTMNRAMMNEIQIMALEAKIVALEMKLDKLMTPTKSWLDEAADSIEEKLDYSSAPWTLDEKAKATALEFVLERAKHLNW